MVSHTSELTRPKLEITKKLEDLGEQLEDTGLVAILNLPDVNLCDKWVEFVERDGELVKACENCVSQFIKIRSMITEEQVHEAIDWFAENYGTMWITVNGRGDPFHPFLVDRTLDKVRHAASRGIGSYVFYPGTDVGHDVCQTLADNGANVMVSLLGNAFIDAEFFDGRQYKTPAEELDGLIAQARNPEKVLRFFKKGLLQDKRKVAENIRGLIDAYRASPNQPEGSTRLGMNYVVHERDLADDGQKIRELREAAYRNGIAFFCNVDFDPHENPDTQAKIVEMAGRFSSHSTSVRGQCQMGAGSSVVVDYNGGMPRCPYQSENGNPNFFRSSQGVQDDRTDDFDRHRKEIVHEHLTNRGYSCVVRSVLRK